MSLAALKKQNSLDALLGAVQKENQPQEKKSYVDERIWKPVMDKTGNGYAVIRFLPAVKGESLPWAKVWNHAFPLVIQHHLGSGLMPHIVLCGNIFIS